MSAFCEYNPGRCKGGRARQGPVLPGYRQKLDERSLFVLVCVCLVVYLLFLAFRIRQMRREKSIEKGRDRFNIPRMGVSENKRVRRIRSQSNPRKRVGVPASQLVGLPERHMPAIQSHNDLGVIAMRNMLDLTHSVHHIARQQQVWMRRSLELQEVHYRADGEEKVQKMYYRRFKWLAIWSFFILPSLWGYLTLQYVPWTTIIDISQEHSGFHSFIISIISYLYTWNFASSALVYLVHNVCGSIQRAVIALVTYCLFVLMHYLLIYPSPQEQMLGLRPVNNLKLGCIPVWSALTALMMVYTDHRLN